MSTQNNVQILGKFCLQHSDADERTHRYIYIYVFYICLSVRSYVAVLKAKFAENVLIVLSSN